MPENIFRIKEEPPDETKIRAIIKDKYSLLESIRKYMMENIGETREEWKYYGVKNGWVLKTFLKKRNLYFIVIYEGYFSISFVFGDKAVESIMEANISDDTKKSLQEARKYAEGRGIYFDMNSDKHMDDIQKLIKIKVG